MKSNLLSLVIAWGIFLFSGLACAQSVDITCLGQQKLDNSDALSSGEIKYDVNSRGIFYACSAEGVHSFYRSDPGQDTCILKITLKGRSVNGFRVSEDLSDIYILTFKELFAVDIASFSRDTSGAVRSLKMAEAYDEIFLDSTTLVLTRAYNEATYDSIPPKARVLLINSESLDILADLRMKHDAIGLTHRPGYYFDVSNGMLLFVRSLHNCFTIVDTRDFSSKEYGNGSPINNGIDRVPFPTNIFPYTNPKEMLMEVSAFAETINYNEGGFWLSDSTFAVVTKMKGGMNSKRKITSYRFDRSSNEIAVVGTTFYHNSMHDKKKKAFFQFYDVNKFTFFDQKLYAPNLYMESMHLAKERRKASRSGTVPFSMYEFSFRP